MMDGVGKAHKRADGAVVAAVSLLVLGTAPLIGVNLYTDKNDALVAPQQIVEAVQVEWSSPAELAGAKLASESDCLAQVMYYEARGEGLAGEKAVAEVVLRRTHNGNYARTVCGVVHEGVREGHKTGCQFSFACDGSLDRPKETASWDQVRLLAEKIMAGAVALGDTTRSAIAFHKAGVTPAWSETMQKTVQIGNHVFYRFVPREQLAQVKATDTAPSDLQEVEPKI